MTVLLRDVVIGIVLFGLVVTGLFTWHVGLADQYNVNLNSSYRSVYNTLNSSIGSSYELTKDIEEKVGKTESIGVVEGFATIGKLALEAVKLPLNALVFITTYLALIASTLGIPTWILTGIISIIILVVAFLVLGAYLRRDV